MRSNDNLRAEYLLIQGQYEAFDQRALSLKALATPLLGAGLVAGLKDTSPTILLVTALVAGSLWLLEAIWKSFQYCFTDRIERLEAWHRGEGDPELAPFQIFSSWNEVWARHYCFPKNLRPILRQPFVCLPYLPMIAVCTVGAIWLMVRSLVSV